MVPLSQLCSGASQNSAANLHVTAERGGRRRTRRTRRGKEEEEEEEEVKRKSNGVVVRGLTGVGGKDSSSDWSIP